MSRAQAKMVLLAGLVLLTLIAYWPVAHHDFINLDDDDYLTKNKVVQQGWAPQGLAWAFTTTTQSHWHPLTWLSHMTDVQLFGMQPGRHHLVSLFFHLANACLLFLIFTRMTGDLYPSALVAALFALHPVNVETVAWISTRKDVLSTFFCLLALWSYLGYIARTGLSRYILVALLLLLALLAKSMAVTLPAVLLLLDYWPLGRAFGPGSVPTHQTGSAPNTRTGISRLILEKIPLFLVVGLFTVLTIVVIQQRTTPNPGLERLVPWASDTLNAFVFYIKYLGMVLWPAHLAIPYPKPGPPPVWEAAAAVIVFLALTGAVLWQARRRPYLPVGWLWFIITLAPVIGVVPTGPHSMADRYLYFPGVGLFVIISWGVADLAALVKKRNMILGAMVLAVVIALVPWTRYQLSFWPDSLTLFTHTIEVYPDQAGAYNALGEALDSQGRTQEAQAYFTEAVRRAPQDVKANYNYGLTLARQKKYQEAQAQYEKTLTMAPNHAPTLTNLGMILYMQGRTEEAEELYLRALKTTPDFVQAHINLGAALARLGRMDECLEHLETAVRLDPENVMALFNLGLVQARQGRLDEAAGLLEKVTRLSPNEAEAHWHLGLVYLGQGRIDPARRQVKLLSRLDPLASQRLMQLLETGGR